MSRERLAPPERDLNISIRVGEAVPSHIRLHRLPPEIDPEYRGYEYFSTDDDIVIVEPGSHRILSEVPRDPSRARAQLSGGSAVAGGRTVTANSGNADCKVMRRDASGNVAEVSTSTVGSSSRRDSLSVTIELPGGGSSGPIPLDAPGLLDDVLAYFERHRAGDVLLGPAAARISGELQQAVDKIDPLPGHIADPARVRAMLGNVVRTLFIGVLNDCFFDPATVLCLNGKAERSTPAMAQCRPDKCPNSCITGRHRVQWEKAIADGETLQRTKGISPLQRMIIEQDVRRYRAAIRRNG